ncbi:response regulator transcription factor [Polyangium mundeleinium]|uniref:Response regulator transcription factor n=1 Tax=Polyangium mundeleinium TaxID=2995306 RepID=A0ABT5EG30_9BACT|nr:response regulator transcription factor [Polyangium mundeleinium]MDC0739750.1 response regulator transcription factor [Polyangium mundeleinium]
MGKKVLVIEDDQELGAQIVKRLRDAGYEATWWKEGRRLSRETLPDVELVVLDLMLPGTYGMDILKDLRVFSEVPVLVLSARNDTADKVRALRLGADDYMTKPFWPEELVERVRARLRRPTLGRGDVVEVGALRIDRGRREVSVRGERVELTRLEFEFLAALAERPGEAMTRSSLAERVLDPERDGTERTLDVHVSRLRKKLGRGAFVETVWGIGYRLGDGRDE